MEIVPTSLVRITRYYMLAAIAYLLLTLATGMWRALWTVPDPLAHWAPAVLGWVTFPIMGAYYQFFPTLQGRDLRWEGLTLPQFALVNVGLIGLVVAAWTTNSTALGVSAIIYSIGALLFVAIILLANIDLQKTVLTLRFYIATLGYFVVAILLFLTNAVGLAPSWATRPLLIHLFVFGWAVTAIMGAEYSMVPMLQLKDLRFPRLADAQFYLVNAAFWALAFSLAIGNRTLIAASGTVLLSGILLFVYVITASLSHGPSRLPRLDISVKYFLFGIGYLVLTAITGIVMSATGWSVLLPIHLHLGLIGAITMTIVGAMYHIVPFVIWWEVYAPRMGFEDVPMLKQLYSERCATIQLCGLNLGLLLMIAGFSSNQRYLLAIGGGILMLVALAFAWAMINVVGHRKGLNRPIGQQEAKKALGGTL